MTDRQYEEYKKVQSFKDKCIKIKSFISNESPQVECGHSRIGYMIDEVNQMKSDLIRICNKNIDLAEKLKEKI